MKPARRLLLFLLVVGSQSVIVTDTEELSEVKNSTNQEPPTTSSPHTSPPHTSPAPPVTDEFWGLAECQNKRLTRLSCDRLFCPPWQRCVEGRCSCKPAYQCPPVDAASVCGRDHRRYRSYCQVMAVSCQRKTPIMSHFGSKCDDQHQKFSSSLDKDTGYVQVFVPEDGGKGEELLVCGRLWDTASANVACREAGELMGAGSAGFVSRDSLVVGGADTHLPKSCVNVRCHGYEMSLAECEIHNKEEDVTVAVATCYNSTQESRDCGFRCSNMKCVAMNRTCDGVDDCGDRSDEMCCKKCRGSAFLCRSGVCVHADSLSDEVMDCLSGEDESEGLKTAQKTLNGPPPPPVLSPEFISPRKETRNNRLFLDSKLSCGIPNTTVVTSERGRSSRVRRVVGGVEASPTQIQWQVAVQERRKIDCGGAYLGGCWVLTAAHCVRPTASAFKIKFSLWRKTQAQGTTDIVPVEKILIHPRYKASTYENDIALIQLKKLPFTEQCLEENPAVTAVCVPWTENLFQANHSCSISGWGRMADGRSSRVLRWANVSLIDGCERFYGDRFTPGMLCAGDLEGNVDSCQGDSGGPLVCQDALGVAYLWGIVSWGERCGQPGFPGIYTKVAHYFEWIRFHTGWGAVTRFNT
ncbi:complement factor I isoform X2 [Gouania willdenowi]|uniref:complement factor I isoform X2 n=1 Tax=Gouania willdenowi TaxID=441366 RepID=UPI0010559CF9|nr:complement factor I isoform X2 [Gouania willdenowi]